MDSRAMPVRTPSESTIGPNGRAPKPFAEPTTNQMPISARGHADQPAEDAPASAPETAKAWITTSQSTPTTPQDPMTSRQAGCSTGCEESPIAPAGSQPDR